ncbi:cyclodeaminase/cyclohydrolase family protein [Nitrospira sp. Kam-Ns4a]
MACRIGPPASAPDSEADRHALARAEQQLVSLRDRLQRLVAEDAAAYDAVVQASRLPKTDPRRPDAIATSLRVATEVPLETASLAHEVATLLQGLAPKVKPSVASDLKVGHFLAIAAIQGGIANAEVNLKSIKDQELERDFSARLRQLQERLVKLTGLC